MIDFNALRRASGRDGELNPIEIFRGLPKPGHVNDLWDTQAEALRGWFDRPAESDLVIKLNTGSGKTLVGLLISESNRRAGLGPSLYLTPTRQLAEQVAASAKEMGIPAEAYDSSEGLSHPFQNGDRTLIATYHTLFNARSRFGLLGAETIQIGSIVVDDAHASAGIIRDIYSVNVWRSRHPDEFRDLANRFRPAFEQVHQVGRFDDMLAHRDEGVMEVPYWAWLDGCEDARASIQALGDEQLEWSLPLLRDHFPFCHALISHEAFSVTPILPLVHLFPSFAECENRVFMSATLADDGLLVRTFAARPESVATPITTRSVAGLGERMILAPALSNLSEDDSRAVAEALCDTASERGVGATILVASEFDAQRWDGKGEVFLGDDVHAAVERLGEDPGSFDLPPVLVNRYDGIDLAQDACRVLVLDGRPRGANQYDLYRSVVLQGHNSIGVTLAQRVEQGIGRGTRGAGDHCVVVLLGKDLVSWLALRETQSVLTPGTRAQLLLSHELAGHLDSVEAVLETAGQCLDRNEDWKAVHADRIAAAGEPDFDSEEMVASARVERRAFENALHQRLGNAVTQLREAAAETEQRGFRAWMLQLAGRFSHQAGDPGLAEELQAEAYSSHRAVTKPRAQIGYRSMGAPEPQAERIVAIIEEYAIRSGSLEAIDNALSTLNINASANQFEAAMRALGRFLGFSSDRPEASTRLGPDNLWLFSADHGLVIECKHLKTTPIKKDEHGQLRTSVEWFQKNYERVACTPVIVHPTGEAREDSEFLGTDARVLTLDALGRVRTGLKAVYREVAFATESRPALVARAAAELERYNLTPASFSEEFLSTGRPA